MVGLTRGKNIKRLHDQNPLNSFIGRLVGVGRWGKRVDLANLVKETKFYEDRFKSYGLTNWQS